MLNQDKNVSIMDYPVAVKYQHILQSNYYDSIIEQTKLEQSYDQKLLEVNLNILHMKENISNKENSISSSTNMLKSQKHYNMNALTCLFIQLSTLFFSLNNKSFFLDKNTYQLISFGIFYIFILFSLYHLSILKERTDLFFNKNNKKNLEQKLKELNHKKKNVLYERKTISVMDSIY